MFFLYDYTFPSLTTHAKGEKMALSQMNGRVQKEVIVLHLCNG